MRDALLDQVLQTLSRQGFLVTSFTEFKSCMDIAAKKPSLMLAIKVLENADGFREESAEELKRLATAFNAVPLLIAEKTKTSALGVDMVYERYGITLLSPVSFQHALEQHPIWSVFFKGRETVQLDHEQLKKQREQSQLSLREVGDYIGASPETIHRYEKGGSAEKKNAEKLEHLFEQPLIQHINVFQWSSHTPLEYKGSFSDPALEKIRELGMELALFEHAPFKAIGKPNEAFLINVGKEKKEIERKALVLDKTKAIFKGHSLVISKEYKFKTIQHTPIFQEEELASYTKIQELLEEVKKREQKSRK